VRLAPAFTGSGASVCDTVRTGADETVVVAADPATGFVWALSRLPAPLVIVVPFASGLATRTTSCAEPEAPAASVPRFQVTVPAACVPASVADTNVVFAGTVSVRTTDVASAVPLLAKVRV